MSGASEPHGAAASLRVFDPPVNPVKTMPGEQPVILVGIEARVVERIAAVAADCFAKGRPGIEHQDGVAMRVCGEHGEHRALRVRAEVEKLSHARMPSKGPARCNPRIFHTIHSRSGRPSRHTALKSDELS